MDEGVHSGNLFRSQSTLNHEVAIDLWADVTEVGWRRRWACTCTGRESDGMMDGRWVENRAQVRSNDWVMGGEQVRGDGQVKSASRIRVHGDCVGGPWCVWAT